MNDAATQTSLAPRRRLGCELPTTAHTPMRYAIQVVELSLHPQGPPHSAPLVSHLTAHYNADVADLPSLLRRSLLFADILMIVCETRRCPMKYSIVEEPFSALCRKIRGNHKVQMRKRESNCPSISILYVPNPKVFYLAIFRRWSNRAAVGTYMTIVVRIRSSSQAMPPDVNRRNVNFLARFEVRIFFFYLFSNRMVYCWETNSNYMCGQQVLHHGESKTIGSKWYVRRKREKGVKKEGKLRYVRR